MTGVWLLVMAGLLLLASDVAQLRITGVTVLGIVLMFVAGICAGMFTREFWIADDDALE